MNYNDEREISKKMFSTMAKLSEAMANSNDSQKNVVRPSDFDYNAEIKKFKSQITSRVDFTTFNIYPETDNVVFGGIFTDVTGFEWQMSLEGGNGLYVTTNNLEVNDEMVSRFQKLKAYYDAFEQEWGEKIITDYKNVSI